jgi:methylase of polypeptide subunit release factors
MPVDERPRVGDDLDVGLPARVGVAQLGRAVLDEDPVAPVAGTLVRERGRLTDDSADVYEAFFVPRSSTSGRPASLDAAGVGTGDRVLDVGCGTGVLAAPAAARVCRSR